MKARTQILLQLPEYYLIALSILAVCILPFTFKLMALAVAVILVLQIIFKNKTTGHIIASFFLIGNLFMLIALTSSMNTIPKFLANSNVLLFGGLLLFAFHLLISGLMILKYPINEQVPKFQIEP